MADLAEAEEALAKREAELEAAQAAQAEEAAAAAKSQEAAQPAAGDADDGARLCIGLKHVTVMLAVPVHIWQRAMNRRR